MKIIKKNVKKTKNFFMDMREKKRGSGEAEE